MAKLKDISWHVKHPNEVHEDILRQYEISNATGGDLWTQMNDKKDKEQLDCYRDIWEPDSSLPHLEWVKEYQQVLDQEHITATLFECEHLEKFSEDLILRPRRT